MKKILYLVPVIALLAVGCSSTPKNNDQATQPTPNPNQTSPQPQQTQPTPNDTGMTEPSNTWTGTLKLSDNSQKGNLMLITSDRTIYIKTSRDFSALVGKEVNVAYIGSMDSFILGNISAK